MRCQRVAGCEMARLCLSYGGVWQADPSRQPSDSNGMTWGGIAAASAGGSRALFHGRLFKHPPPRLLLLITLNVMSTAGWRVNGEHMRHGRTLKRKKKKKTFINAHGCKVIPHAGVYYGEAIMCASSFPSPGAQRSRRTPRHRWPPLQCARLTPPQPFPRELLRG